jgi:hypothetical protein
VRGEWEKFAASVAASGIPDSSTLYARIVWNICQSLQVNLFKESTISWPLLKHSFEEWTKAYPASLETISAFCIHSGYAGDCETMRRLFSIIGDRADMHVWYTEDNFLKKRAWAFKKCQ